MTKLDQLRAVYPELEQEFGPYDFVEQAAFRAAAAVMVRGGTVAEAARAANVARAAAMTPPGRVQ